MKRKHRRLWLVISGLAALAALVAVVLVIYEDSIGAAYRGLGFISSVVTHPESDAQVHGIDAHYLGTDGVWQFDGQYVHSDIDEEGSGNGLFTDFAYQPRQGLRHTLQLTYFDDLVDVNDFGFQRRNDIREAYEGLVLELSTRPPETLLAGDRVSHDVKCFAVGHLLMSSPHSDRRRSTVNGPNPWI